MSTLSPSPSSPTGVEHLLPAVSQDTLERPSYLRIPRPHRVLLCTYCGKCYVRKNYERHIGEVHHLKGSIKRLVLEWLSTEDVADEESEVQPPLPNQPLIQGLPDHDGYACNFIDCQYLTTSEQLIRKHTRKAHHQSYHLNNDAVSRVKLQAFFAKSPRYFRVTNLNATTANPATSLVSSINTSDARNNLDNRYQLSLHSASQGTSNHGTQHISEITPWLRVTGFPTHKETIGNVDDFRDVLRLPRRENDRSLSLVCESVDRILHCGLDRVQNDQTGKRLHRLDAQHLNSFQAGVTSQDPFQRLDRKHSIQAYSKLFQQLVCYFFRVEDDHFGRAIFQTTDLQRQCSIDVLEEATRQAQASEADDAQETSNTDHATSDEEVPGSRRAWRGRAHRSRREIDTGPNERRLDQLTLAFCLSLIQHRLDDSSFDNAMLSFCAVLAWDSSRKAWRKDVGNYSSYLSQLIYVCQLLVLLHCDSLLKDGQCESLSEAIVAQRDRWLQNTSRGPVGDLQAWRLYARSVARSSVGVAQIRWHRDGVTLAYRDISYKVSYLHDEMIFCLDEARRIFQQDLALDLSDVPVYRIEELVDDWDNSTPQKSFIDDCRNADCLDDGKDWLYDQILSSATLADHTLQKDTDSRWVVRPDFAQQYEMRVQHFLELMLTLLHKGSGQPARRPEMLGLRWQNTLYDQRNLLIHDGYVLFILTYHKSQSQSHGSRYPVRFLLPEAGVLLVQFLVLIQPFRRWMSQETGIPTRVTEFLWSGSSGVWSDDRMTRLIQRNSLLSIGVSTHVQAWRQIAVGIAVKFFSGTGYQADLDRQGDADDDHEGRTLNDNMGDMPEVFHYQATHAPRTGNQVYGGTINFKDGLTDAGLQQYL